MPNTIIIKNSSTVSDVPTAGQLEQGELALNLLDEKLYSKNSSDIIFEIGAGGGDVTKVGTPANDQIGVWTGDGTLEGTSNLAQDSSGVLHVKGTLGGYVRVYDTDDTDSILLRHSGTAGYIYSIGANTTNLRVVMPTSGQFLVTDASGFAKLSIYAVDETVNVRDGYELRILDTDDTDYMSFQHDSAGGDFNMVGVNTTDFNITGITHFNVVNFNFNVDQAVGVGQDNYVLTYDNASGLIGLEVAPSLVPVSTGASNVLRGDGAGGWVEETDLTISAAGALATDASVAVSDGTDSLNWSATAGATLFQPTGGMNSVEFNIRLIVSDKLTINNLFLDERASAGTDVTGDGQLWCRNDPSQTLWFTPEGGTDYPVGYNSMPVVAISASQNMLLAQVGYMLHKSSGVAITLTCAQDSNTWDGATWVAHNDDTEDLTIAAGASVTVYWIEAGSAPAAGSVTVEQGGLVTIYKRSNTEFWVWGGKEANPGLSYPLTPQDNQKIIFGTGSDAEIYSDGSDLYIDLAVTGDFRLRGGSADDVMITAFTNSFVQLAYDGTVKFSTTSTGANVIGVLTADGLDMEDNHHVLLGTGDDVDMYFNATDFYIDMIDGADFRLRGGTGETELMVLATANSNVALYHNGGLEFRTQQHEGSSITSGAECYDHAGTLRDVGFNHVKVILITGNITLDNTHAGCMLLKVNAGTYVVTMASSTTEFPNGSMCTILNHGTGGSLTISDGAENMFVMDGSGTVVNHAGFVLAVAGALTVWRESTDDYYIWGAGVP